MRVHHWGTAPYLINCELCMYHQNILLREKQDQLMTRVWIQNKKVCQDDTQIIVIVETLTNIAQWESRLWLAIHIE